MSTCLRQAQLVEAERIAALQANIRCSTGGAEVTGQERPEIGVEQVFKALAR